MGGQFNARGKNGEQGESFVNAPRYSPLHRWVFCSDMRPDEAWYFKQYDTREGVAKASFHAAVFDPFYANDPKIPERFSVELRLLLTFPPQMKKKSAEVSKL